MANQAPALPPLPPGFGNESSYPPHPSSASASSSRVRPTPVAAPPVPPLPPGALEREAQYRAQNFRASQPSFSSPPPLHPPPPLSSSGFVPGQLITASPSLPPHHNGGPRLQPAPSIYGRSPSPGPSYGPPASFSQSIPGFPQPQHHGHAPYPRQHTLSPPPPPPDRPHSANSYHSIGGGHGGRPDGRLSPQPSAPLHADGGSNMPSISQSMSTMALGAPPPSSFPAANQNYGRRASSSEAVSSPNGRYPQRRQASASIPNGGGGATPSLNSALPDMDALERMRERALASRDDQQQVAWAKQLLKFVERKFTDGSKISEPRLVKSTDEAISTIKRLASMARPNLEALYLRGDLQASGAFPTYIRKDLKEAFNDFELSARLGYAASWFRIGRDYELLNDFTRARDAYNRGVVVGDVGSMYRLGMAHLLGQLDIGVHQSKAVSLLRDAADRANLDVPQPAYIYGMLLAGEFNHVDIPAGLLKPTLSPDASFRGARGDAKAALEHEARRRIERAAYLNFAPAQYKCGWNYEYAQLDCAFDPLLSVQYYSLASQGGEVEADMALSKWFLCGAEGCFDKNEGLAFTFADKAARKGLASAEFALGYYFEVGVGTERNLDTARRWYKKAAAQDNEDAKERIKALQAGGGGEGAALSRGDHEANVDEKVQRKRTLARIRSEKEGRGGRTGGGGGGGGAGGATPSGLSNGSATAAAAQHGGGSSNTELNRRKTMKMVEDTAAGRGRRTGERRGFASEQMPAMPMPPLPSSMPEQQAVSDSPRRPRPTPGSGGVGGGGGGGGAVGPHDRLPSSRYGQGYTLSDTPASTSQGPSSASSSSASPGSGPGFGATSSAATSYTNGSGGGGGGGNASSATSSSNPTKPNQPLAKVYSTFEEMGFKPQKAKRDECVIA